MANATTRGGSRLRGEMGPEADAVDLDAVALDELDDALGAISLGAVVLEVVVVEKLGLGVDLRANLKAKGRKASPMVLYQTLSRVGPSSLRAVHLVSTFSVFPSGDKLTFVHHVPACAATLVPAARPLM